MLDKILHNKLFLYGAAGLLVIVLVMRLVGSSASSTGTVTTVAAGPTDAQISASTTLALAQIDSAKYASGQSASMALAQYQLQEQLTEKGIDADLARYSIDAQVLSEQRQLQAANAADERNANLSATIAKWTMDTQTALQANNNSFQLSYASNANESAEHMAEITASVARASIDANAAVNMASLQSSAAQAASFVNAQVAMTESDNARDVGIANINGKVTKHGQTTGLIGSIIGGALSIFSDRRLKNDVVLLGRERDGLGAYAYRLGDSPSFQVGVMADEVAALRPHAMGPVIEGVFTVNYKAL